MCRACQVQTETYIVDRNLKDIVCSPSAFVKSCGEHARTDNEDNQIVSAECRAYCINNKSLSSSRLSFKKQWLPMRLS